MTFVWAITYLVIGFIVAVLWVRHVIRNKWNMADDELPGPAFAIVFWPFFVLIATIAITIRAIDSGAERIARKLP